VPWRGSDLDSVVLLCLGQYGPLKTNALIEAIDKEEWERARIQQLAVTGKRPTGSALEYQGMLTRLHRLADAGVVAADRDGGAYTWRLLSSVEREQREDQLHQLWRCPTALARRIERSAKEMEGTVEFMVLIEKASRFDRYWGYEKVTAALIVKLPRGELIAAVREPEEKAWASAAEECGLL
jgi:hypothetical protein